MNFNAIPYKGDAAVMQNLLGGQTDFGSVTLSSASEGGLRILALFGQGRNPGIPDVPTLKEQGFDVAPYSFGGLLAPAGIPDDVKGKLGTACRAAAEGDNYKRLAKTLIQPDNYYADGAAFARSLDKDLEDKSRLLAAIGGLK